jgi:hypothetical protein
MIAAIGDLAAFEGADGQIGAVPEGPDFHPAKVARREPPGGPPGGYPAAGNALRTLVS